MRRSRFAIRPLSLAITFSLSFSASAAINSAAIIASTLSPTCLEYKVVGICYWLLCTPFGCKVKTSTKVRHYVPDAVVSAYANTGMNPWIEMSNRVETISLSNLIRLLIYHRLLLCIIKHKATTLSAIVKTSVAGQLGTYMLELLASPC